MTLYHARIFVDVEGGMLILSTKAAAGWLAMVSLITLTMEVVVIVGRFLNCGCTVTRATCCYAMVSYFWFRLVIV